MRRDFRPGSYVPLTRRRRRRRQKTAAAAAVGGTAIVVLAMVLGFGLPGGRVDAAGDSCILVLVADRSASSDDDGLAYQRRAEAHDVLDQNAHCNEVIISEIRGFYGEADVVVLPLQKESNIWTERIAHERDALELAHAELDRIFLSPTGRRTNAIATLDELANQVAAVANAETTVDAFFWWDGIQSVAPLNMRRLFNRPVEPAAVLARLPRVPECPQWKVRFVGVNRTAHTPLPPKVAAAAEDFWYAYVERCGGELVLYGPTLSSNERPDLPSGDE